MEFIWKPNSQHGKELLNCFPKHLNYSHSTPWCVTIPVSLHPRQHCEFQFWSWSHHVSKKWYLMVSLVNISLVMMILSIFLCANWPFVHLLGINVYSNAWLTCKAWIVFFVDCRFFLHPEHQFLIRHRQEFSPTLGVALWLCWWFPWKHKSFSILLKLNSPINFAVCALVSYVRCRAQPTASEVHLGFPGRAL